MPRRCAPVVPVLLVAALTLGCAQRAPGIAPRTDATAGRQARQFHSVRTYAAAPLPVRVRIPAIGVSSPLEHLHRLPDGTIGVPSQWGVAGWYADGPRPGDPGPAVVLGHVDSTSGPAVFYRLRELAPGDSVLVDQAGGGVATFRVTSTQWVPKDHFPTEQVYLPTLDPELRLVTCGGSFDRKWGHYTENLIVSAVLTGTTAGRAP